jgi:hypothetical protein
MNIFKLLKKKRQVPDVNTIEIKHAAERAFKQYQKSYKDLARHDRGEKIFNN